MHQRTFNFLKKETVFSAATLLAVASAFLVVPDKEYLGYINLHVLGLLLSMMLVMEGYKKANLFSRIGEKLMHRSMGVRTMGQVLTSLCFFSSMLITNDVALITFVPFTVFMLRESGKPRYLVPIVTLQTVAANLGSMLTPIGNPQNLFLYTLSGLSPGEFCLITLPYCILSLALLILCTFLLPKSERLGNVGTANGLVAQPSTDTRGTGQRTDKKRTAIFTFLFLVCLLTVFRIVPWWASLMTVAGVVLLLDRKIFLSPDYFLLLTFVAFFVLIGNIQRLGSVRDILEALVRGREVLVGTAASQIISNVPAAILLSGFTTDVRSLVIGVSLGGLGTLIASMASLISYKVLAHECNSLKGRYIVYFSIFNIIFLAILIGFHQLIA